MTPHENWTSGSKSAEINSAMRDAYTSFDRAYHRSNTNAQLSKNIDETLAALRTVARLVKTQVAEDE